MDSESFGSLISVLQYEDFIKKICNNQISDLNEYILPNCIEKEMPKDSTCQKKSFSDSINPQDLNDDLFVKMMTYLYHDPHVKKCAVIDSSEK